MRALVFLALLLSFVVPSPGQGQQTTLADVVVETRVDDQGQEFTILTIPSKNGQVSWQDVGTALVRAAKLDDKAVVDLLPDGTVNIESSAAGLVLLAANVAADGALKFERTTTPKGSALRITCNQSILDKHKREAIAAILDTPAESPLRDPEFVRDLQWDAAPVTAPHVICVHGYAGSLGTFAHLSEHLRENNCTVAKFGYDFRQTILASAKQLREECLRIKQQQPQVKLVILGHSMGGLVGRAMIETPELDPGNVNQLITIGTPQAGSMWTHCPPILNAKTDDGFDFIALARLTVGVDHLAAFKDLRPDSDFLKQLNARPRNPKVRYTLIIGNSAPLKEAEAIELKSTWKTCCDTQRPFKLVQPRLDPFLSDLAEVTDGTGDGAVAVTRAKLAGVQDVVILPFEHQSVLVKGTGPVQEQVWQEVMKRLR